MSLIGLMCKRGDTFSLQVLIGRGLFLFDSCEFGIMSIQLYSVRKVFQKNLENRLTNESKCVIIVKQFEMHH